MDMETCLSDHNILKEPNSLQSTPLYKLFPESQQLYGDIYSAFYKSPKNKINKTTPQIKAKVKRNLNDSFSETPNSNNKNSPNLNYSVISENVDEAQLVLRLRLSKNQPYVDLKHSPEFIDKLTSLPVTPQFSRTIKKTRRISFADERLPLRASAKKVGSTRRSSRGVERKSYTELLSPEKIPDDNLANSYYNYERSSLKKRENGVQSPRKRSRSKSVDSSKNDFSIKSSLRNTVVTPSPKKRNRPRRSSVTQQSYKEIFTDDEQNHSDLYGSDSSFPSPVKRVLPKRNSKLPARYVDISDDELINGVSELAMSDDENDNIISLLSPEAKVTNLIKNTNLVNREETNYLISNDNETFQKSEKEKVKLRKYSSDRWRTPVKAIPRSCTKKSPKFESPVSHNSTTSRQTYIPNSPVPLSPSLVDRRRNERTPRSSNRKSPKAKSPVQYKSPVKESKHTPKTPRTPRPDKSPKLSSPASKSQKAIAHTWRLMRAGVLTPTVQSRVSAVKAASTPLNKARIALHVAHVPDALPCREKEAADIYGFVEGKLLDGFGGCMYISGVPGTGKTATVTYVIRELQEQSRRGDLPKFDYVSVNGMRLTEPRQSYVEILKQLTNKVVPWEQAHTQLNSKFTKKGQASKPIVLLIDELDILCTKRQDVVYNLLDWPSKAYCQLIVVTIANTMDLPERLLMGRVTSRLGLTRLTFQAYNYKQLQEIVTKRLFDTKTFNPDAIQLVARKVASVSGDARRALDICRMAAERAEADGKNSLVSMAHVNDALDSMMTQPKIRAIKSSSRLQKLLLQSIVAEIERTGVEETTFSAVFKILSSVAAIDGFVMVTTTIAMAAIAKLGSCRLLLLDQKNSGLYQRIMLNVSVDDVYYALKSE